MSMRSTAWLYQDGKGVPQSHLSAYKWYELAGRLMPKEETEQARKALAADREPIAAKLNSSEITEAKRQAQEWLDKRPWLDQR